MNRCLLLIIFLAIITSCNHQHDEKIVVSEESIDYLSEMLFRFDMTTYVLISEKYGFTDLRLINAMKEYQKDNQIFNIDTTNFDIAENTLLDSTIVEFRKLASKYNISPDTLASAILDFKFSEKYESNNFQ